MRAVKRTLMLGRRVVAAGLHPTTSSLLSRMAVQPSTSRITAMDALVVGLDADGLLSKLSGLFDLAAETEQAALLDWTGPGRQGANNGCTFTANAGFRPGAGPSNWIDLGFAPGARLDSLNSIAAGCWTNIMGSAFPAAATIQMGTSAANRNDIGAADGAVLQYVKANDTTSGNLGNGTGSRVGHRGYSRTAAGVRKGYINGSNTLSDTQASTALGTGNFTLFRSNTNYNIRDDSVCFAWVASGLTDTEWLNLHNRLATYKGVGIA